MKKFLFTMLLSVAAVIYSNAEVGNMAGGMEFNYASKFNHNGLGLNYEVEVAKNLRLSPQFVYFFEDGGQTEWNINIDLKYRITTGGSTIIYPFAGYTYCNTSWDDFKGEDRHGSGANVGLGFEYLISDSGFSLFSEERFQIVKNHNQALTTIGLRYNF